MEPESLSLPTGLTITIPNERLLRFCHEEYDYYDGITDADLNHVTPIDVLVTNAVNSGISSGSLIRTIHRHLASRCDPILQEIAIDASLADGNNIELALRLLDAAWKNRVEGLATSRIAKILHRKRPSLLPMLDDVVLRYYAPHEQPSTWLGRERTALEAFRSDLRMTEITLKGFQGNLERGGYRLSTVRILEILVWTECESHGYYR